jgi:aspartyl-tRNA(Asn)/glutamyl-tRNA(Gln) amidotransferase subunit A
MVLGLAHRDGSVHGSELYPVAAACGISDETVRSCMRRLIADDFQKAFQHCDVIAGPVAPTVARAIGASSDPVSEYLADIFTLPASLAGLPGISVPAGFGEGGLPVGLQLIGNYWQEGQLLHTAHAFQQVTDFHRARPEGY